MTCTIKILQIKECWIDIMNFTFFPNRTSADLQVHAHKHSHHFYYRIFTYKRYCDISFEVGFPAKIFAFFSRNFTSICFTKTNSQFPQNKNAKISWKNANISRKNAKNFAKYEKISRKKMEIMQKSENFAKIQNLKKSIFMRMFWEHKTHF